MFLVTGSSRANFKSGCAMVKCFSKESSEFWLRHSQVF